ncbi:MAG TPA: tripartite tricarboxylate transporter substrate binding protein, partial [Xanthobacteraceae bacterium]|nr:tripartite tricarboxylate transporter substrate binding protein [Xanthobacteraceae bacterium]
MRAHERDVDGRRGRRGAALAIGLVALGAVLAAAMPLPARAETDYPNRPVRIFIPYGPGGVADVTMRLLAQKLGEATKQQFVIENRPGAGGLLAVKGVLDSPADGYTLGVVGNGQAIGVSLFKSRPYNPLTDFTHVAITARFEMLLAVPGASTYRSLQDVVAAARKNPGKLNLGAINPGSTQNLSAHMFKQMSGLDVAIIPYKTTPDLVTALLRRDVDVGFDYFAGFQGALSDNKVRIIATSGEARDPLLPAVPTAKESGFPDYVVTSWNGLAS